VLIALACEELVVLSDVEVGLAGIDEPQLEPTVVQAYLDVAAKRGMIPLAAVRSMLDPAAPLVQLDLEGGGIEFTSVPDLESKGRPEGAWRERQLVPTNKLATFTGQEMRQWRWIAHAIAQPEFLQAALKLSSPPKEKASFALPRHPTVIQLRGILHRRIVTRTIRAIDDAITNEGADLILLEIDSPGGSFEESMRLAFHLAKIPNERAEVVAYVSGYARADAALIPLAADLVYMAPNALLGTGGEASIRWDDIEQNKPTIAEFANLTKRNPGDIVGLIYPSASVHEFFSAMVGVNEMCRDGFKSLIRIVHCGKRERRSISAMASVWIELWKWDSLRIEKSIYQVSLPSSWSASCLWRNRPADWKEELSGLRPNAG